MTICYFTYHLNTCYDWLECIYEDHIIQGETKMKFFDNWLTHTKRYIKNYHILEL